MKEYVEREALLSDISESVLFTVRGGVKTPTAEMRGASKVIDRIKEAKAADVVEVVRCKDCKHCTIYRCSADGGIKQIRCHYDIGTYDEDFYCPLGEKMDGKGEDE